MKQDIEVGKKHLVKLHRKFHDMYKELQKELTAEASGSYLELDKERELWFMRSQKPRFQWYFQGIPSSEEQLRILDIGTTPFTFLLKRFYPHYDIYTIDLTDLMKQRAEARGIAFKKCDLQKGEMPFAENYCDVVIFTEVLEHLFLEPAKIFGEISRVLKSDGCLIFSVPNFALLRNRIKLLFGINPQHPIEAQIQDGWVHGHGHIREYTMGECVSILKANGFSIKEKKFLQYSVLRFDKNVIDAVARLAYYLVCKIIPPFRQTICIKCEVSAMDKVGRNLATSAQRCA